MIRKGIYFLSCLAVSTAPLYAYPEHRHMPVSPHVRISADKDAAHTDIGVLVLAHGGSAQWNQVIVEAVHGAALSYPTAISFGMGMNPESVKELQAAIDGLQQEGVSRLVVVPLFVSSHSQVKRQLDYLLGMRSSGPWQDKVSPLMINVPLVMTSVLDDDPVVSEVLLDRALSVSKDPDRETVVIIAHGPNHEQDNKAWLTIMDTLSLEVKKRGGFRAVTSLTMRDDAPKPVLDSAIKDMREVIESAGLSGRVIVLPLLVAKGGIEHKIEERLRGLNYTYQNNTLLPDGRISDWISKQVENAIQGLTHGVAQRLVIE